MSSKGIQLTPRDYEIFRLVYRFRFCLGRHIKQLNYDNQIWIISEHSKKINEVLTEMKEQLPDIKILSLEEVLSHVN